MTWSNNSAPNCKYSLNRRQSDTGTGQGSTTNESVVAGDPARQKLLKRKTLFKGGQRTQEESTTIAVISKDFKKKQNMNNIRVLNSNMYKTVVIF